VQDQGAVSQRDALIGETIDRGRQIFLCRKVRVIAMPACRLTRNLFFAQSPEVRFEASHIMC
jgi:hypothetical protein